MSWQAYLAVGIGSGIGSALRYGVSLASIATLGSYFPWGTLLVNVLGSCLIGWLAVSVSHRPTDTFIRLQPLLAVGFCGGFTTFSLFSLETLHFVNQGQVATALVYILVSLPLWLLAAGLGGRLALSSAPDNSDA